MSVCRRALPILPFLLLLALVACGGEPAPPTRGGQGDPPAGGAAAQPGSALPTDARPLQEDGGAAPVADSEAGDTKFTRFASTGKTEGTYETALVGYEDDDGRRVDLVGVVHVGDAPYYDELQRRLAGYDSVLYELVAERGTRPEPGHKGDSPVSALQRFLKQGLELEFQLDRIDYSKPNFVHADMSPAEMKRKMDERGESIWTYVLRSMMNPPAQDGAASKITVFHFLAGFLSADRARYHKFLLAQFLDDIELSISSLGAEKGKESVLIGDRNAACMKVLDESLRTGGRKLAVFYGAGHMPDLERRLGERGFHRVAHEWLVAWDLRIPGGAAGTGNDPGTTRDGTEDPGHDGHEGAEGQGDRGDGLRR